jgi:PAS domain-containing protein
MVEALVDPLVVLDADMNVLAGNRAFYGLCQISPESTVGGTFFNLGDAQWEIPKLRKPLEKALTKESQIQRIAAEQEFPGIGRKSFTIDARRIYRDDLGTEAILLVVRDIGARV